VDGELDKGCSYGTVSTDFMGHTDFPFSIAIQPDGKIVVAGYAYNTAVDSDAVDSDYAVARYKGGDCLIYIEFGSFVMYNVFVHPQEPPNGPPPLAQTALHNRLTMTNTRQTLHN